MYIHDMKARVSQWGNSLGVRIPRAVAESAGVSEGELVEIAAEGNTIVLRRAARRYTLEELLKGIKKSNRHEETDWGRPVGKEIL